MEAKKYEYKGQMKSLKEWGEEYGVPEYVLRERIHRGSSLEKALTTPAKRRFPRKQGSVQCPYPKCDACPYPDCRR